MQKIMFNDRYGLTQAVLEGRKTQTRRIIEAPKTWHGLDVYGFSVNKDNLGNVTDITLVNADGGCMEDVSGNLGMILPKYRIGETVAVAQSYKDAGYVSDTIQEGKAVRKSIHSEDWDDSMIGKLGAWYIDQLPGWTNKMFTFPEMMSCKIRITGIKVEKLRDISDDDCLKEGIYSDMFDDSGILSKGYMMIKNDGKLYPTSYYEIFDSPREAFAHLIDKVSGKGTWDRNHYVFVYDFEFVK